MGRKESRELSRYRFMHSEGEKSLLCSLLWISFNKLLGYYAIYPLTRAGSELVDMFLDLVSFFFSSGGKAILFLDTCRSLYF
jgi:hypothetical protein